MVHLERDGLIDGGANGRALLGIICDVVNTTATVGLPLVLEKLHHVAYAGMVIQPGHKTLVEDIGVRLSQVRSDKGELTSPTPTTGDADPLSSIESRADIYTRSLTV
jgi:hypothetical protein